jgi:methylated-DNA-[protein]-cysteine S-methyltransferase
VIEYDVVDSPIGRLVLSGRDGVLEGVRFTVHRGTDPVGPGWVRVAGRFAAAAAQLTEWFAGLRTDFELETRVGGTPMQRRMWRALATIPYGETRTYSELARRLGTSPRAVGGANACNPLSIVVPCHRLVAADGDLTGYAGGVEAKRWLLAHERHVAGKVGSPSLQP